MVKKSTLNISKNITNKIPYQRCYEEHGIIETEHGIFLCAYEICSPIEQMHVQYNIQLVRNCMESILTKVVKKGISYQFCICNRGVDTVEDRKARRTKVNEYPVKEKFLML